MNNIIYEILNSINKLGYESYVVGGYVRDYLLGISSSDIDITTNAPVNKLLTIFGVYNPKKFPYDTIKFQVKNLNIDIAQMRKEVYDGTSSIITFTDDLNVDFLRRDFTMNSIYMDKASKLYDFGTCIDDCKNKRLKFISDPKVKCLEDPVRFIRGLYLILKYDIEDYTDMNSIVLTYEDFSKCNLTVLNKTLFKILKLNKNNEFVNLLHKFNMYDILFKQTPYSCDLKPIEFLKEAGYVFIDSI